MKENSPSTDLMVDDLVQVEQSVDLIKTTFTETIKRLKSIIHFSSKPKKKIDHPSIVLGQTLIESSVKYSDDSLLYFVLHKTGQSVTQISGETMNYESRLDSEIIQPLNKILETHLDEIDNIRKNLIKAKMELDSLTAKQLSSQKQNLSKEKIQAIEEDIRVSSSKFENARDLFITELLRFISKEQEYCLLFIRLMELEEDYHKRCLQILSKMLPAARKMADLSIFQPVFGISLEKHFLVFHQEISFVLEDCANAIAAKGLKLTGIFRLAGSALRIKKFKAGFDAGILNIKAENLDLISMAGVMKQYLRDLPEPLLTYELEDEWNKLTEIDQPLRKQYVEKLVKKLPHLNYLNLKFLIKFLAQVAENSDSNKMTTTNLSIVFGPNLLWSKDESKNMICSSSSCLVVDIMIINYTEIFGKFESTSPLKDKTESQKPKAQINLTSPPVASLDKTSNPSSEF